MNNPTPFPEPTVVAINDVVLEVFEAGKENAGNPIVLCHGWPEHAYSWRHQIFALADAGFHVIVPNQRGYGNSSRPTAVEDYDIAHLSGDLVALLDHFGYKEATFVGHDWGAMVVWGLTLLHPDRVTRLINLSVPYMERGDTPWVEFLDALMGTDSHIVHFNRLPGVADAVFDANTPNFLRNLYRKDVPPMEPQPGMPFIGLATAEAPLGQPLMSDLDLSVFVSAFEATGFTSSINWYRNLDRNWHLLAEVDPVIKQPALMIYGTQDQVARNANLNLLVPNVDEVTLDCGHWIQQELPEQTNAALTDWLRRQGAM